MHSPLSNRLSFRDCCKVLPVLLVLSLLILQATLSASPKEIVKKTIAKTDETETVTTPQDEARLSEERILRDLKYLASDEREGRGPGSQGQKEAAAYIQKNFADAGLVLPNGEDDAFLEFVTPNFTSMGKVNKFVIQHQGNKPQELKLHKEFNPCSFGTSGTFDAPIVFCGYGFELGEGNYNDYENVDLKGKVAVIVRRVPFQSEKKTEPFFSNGRIHPDASLIRKMEVAHARGAVGVVFLTDPYSIRNAKDRLVSQIDTIKKRIETNPETADRQKRLLLPLQKSLKETNGDRLIPFGYGGSSKEPKIPVLHMRNEQFDQILKTAGFDSLEKLESQIDADRKPKSFDVKGVTFKAEVSINRNETKASNIIGVIPGNGPLAEETIVIGAHYDHVGRGGRGSMAPNSTDIHNGADDNASGTTLVLELARRISRHKSKLNCRVVFMTFAAEELGLLGSKAYVQNPVILLEKTIAMLNFDMVGRSADNVITVFGTGTSSVWGSLIDEGEKKHRFFINRKPPGFGPSDHSSFYKQKVPVLHFFTGLAWRLSPSER